MKVCFLIRAMERGGAEVQLTSLACGLSRRGHDVSVLTFYPGGVLENALRDAGVSVASLGKSGRGKIVSSIRTLVRTVRQKQPDILHGYLPTANLLALLSRPFIGGTKIIIGVRASDMDLSRYDAVTAWSYRIERLLSRFAHAMIANSHAGANIYSGRLPFERTFVIPNGIDVNVFRPDPVSPVTLRDDLGIGESSPLIGLVARIDPMKDHETFLRAASIVHAARPDVQFVCIAGNIHSLETSGLRQRAQEYGITANLHWAGPFDDLSNIYPALDALTLASVCGEGFPNVVAEAMACGVPCVVTDVGDAAVVVGETGRVVPIGDAEALAAGLMEMVSLTPGEKAGLSDAARDRIASRFNKDDLVERTGDILERVMAI